MAAGRWVVPSPSRLLAAGCWGGVTHLPNSAPASAETKLCLYALFGQFGKIMDIVCMRTERLHGRRVVFADITAATNALRAMQGFSFFDKPLVSPPALLPSPQEEHRVLPLWTG